MKVIINDSYNGFALHQGNIQDIVLSMFTYDLDLGTILTLSADVEEDGNLPMVNAILASCFVYGSRVEIGRLTYSDASPAMCRHENFVGYCAVCAAEDCETCWLIKHKHGGFGPRHDGSKYCESGSIASGGKNSHCTCDTCF